LEIPLSLSRRKRRIPLLHVESDLGSLSVVIEKRDEIGVVFVRCIAATRATNIFAVIIDHDGCPSASPLFPHTLTIRSLEQLRHFLISLGVNAYCAKSETLIPFAASDPNDSFRIETLVDRFVRDLELEGMNHALHELLIVNVCRTELRTRLEKWLWGSSPTPLRATGT
jgi:hypothetical protein